jgi:hypothetical protein
MAAMSPKPKMQPKKAAKKAAGGARSKQERIDDAIMNVSYMPNDHQASLGD